MKELIGLAQDNIPWITTMLIAISFVFEFSKIKLNPWSWIFKHLKKKLTEDIHDENMAINKRLDKVVYVKSKHYDEIVEGLNNMNQKIVDAIGSMNSKLDEMYQCQDENEMVRLRWEILSFADSCKGGSKHSKDAFHHIIETNDKYHKIIEKRNFTNGVIDAEMDYIMSTYRELRDKDGFV